MEGKNKMSSGGKSRWLFLIIGMIIGVILTSTFYYMKENRSGVIIAKELYDNTFSIESLSPLYFELEPFTLNLKSANQSGGRILYIGLTLKLSSEESQRIIKDFLPEIRSQLLILFSQQAVDDLLTIEGKQQLAIETKNIINQLVIQKKEIKVVDVLFNAFILR